MKTQQRGFTLVELIVVIVILGILAATALPRFVNLGGEARAATMQAVAATMESAKALVQAKWLAAGSANAISVPVPGATGGIVTVITDLTAQFNGNPDSDAGGMDQAIIRPTGIACVGAPATTICTYTGYVGCTATYTRATGVVSVAATAATCI